MPHFIPKVAIVTAAAMAAAMIILTAYFWMNDHQKGIEARALGYDQMSLKEIRGVDGKAYSVKIYWKIMRSIPGRNPVFVRVSDSSGRFSDQHFDTGSRSWLTGVSVLHHPDSDELLLKMDDPTGNPKFHSSRISHLGLADYPHTE